MTQMQFDFTVTAGVATATIYAPATQPDRIPAPTPVASARSLPLYDPRQGELHHMGDLAQAVLARYDMVHRRRAARLRREAEGARAAG